MQQKVSMSAKEIIAENIPEELKIRPQWVNWRYELRGEEWTKVPYSPESFERASATDLMTWSSFEKALATLKVGDFDGIGFVFCSADPFVGIDFDHCRDPQTGEVDEKVLDFVRSFESSYVEASVSGTGVHLITTGKCKDGKKRANREVYGQDRFFCMTGATIGV